MGARPQQEGHLYREHPFPAASSHLHCYDVTLHDCTLHLLHQPLLLAQQLAIAVLQPRDFLTKGSRLLVPVVGINGILQQKGARQVYVLGTTSIQIIPLTIPLLVSLTIYLAIPCPLVQVPMQQVP